MKAQEILELMWLGLQALDSSTLPYAEMELSNEEAKEWLNDIMDDNKGLVLDPHWDGEIYRPSLRERYY